MGRVKGGGQGEVGAKTSQLWSSATYERDDSQRQIAYCQHAQTSELKKNIPAAQVESRVH